MNAIIYHSDRSMPYVYICVHQETNRFYIGYREKNVKLNRPSTIDLPLYKTSSKDVHNNFNEFNWEIIAEFFNANDAYDFEQNLIREHWKNPLLINKQFHTTKTARFKLTEHSEKTKRKMQKPKPPRSDEHKRNISKAKTGKKCKLRSDEHKRNISKAKTGKKRPPMTELARQNNEKAAKARIGIKLMPFTDDHKRKMSEAKIGKKRKSFTDDHRKKLREANARRRLQKQNIIDSNMNHNLVIVKQ